MGTALVTAKREDAHHRALRADFGPVGRALADRYFRHVRFPPETEERLRSLSSRGFLVHVMRTSAWVNFLYLAWVLVLRGLPPIRASVNLRRWWVKPWRRTVNKGPLAERFGAARRSGGSALVFLQSSALMRASGRRGKQDPFPTLIAMARASDRPVFLVPELFVWEKWNVRLKPAWADYVFGSPEAPGFLHSLVAFWRNHKRAQFRVGEPVDLRAFVERNPDVPDDLLARKVRGALHVHLARETRAVFGPPYKPAERIIEETLRDRGFRASLEEIARSSGRRPEAVEREAKKNLNAIAARLHPTALAVLAPVLHWVFNRMYDGIEVDEPGLERALRGARGAPIVLCPSHKSHADYLVMSWILWARGFQVPLVAAGANLSFFPLGSIFRRGGAFFLRRSFKDDKVYTATFKAYVKKLVHEGVHQEFFPEGGRSRTGKLLQPKLGLLTWEVDAVLEGARDDLAFLPVSIDYEKVVEGSSYGRELLGGEKKPEDFKALLRAPKVLSRNYGRVHVTFDEPILLRELMASRGLEDPATVTDRQKRSLVRALGQRIMYGIARVSTVTPQALVSTALLAFRGRGLRESVLGQRIALLRRVAEEEGARLSTVLEGAPSEPAPEGPIHEALRRFGAEQLVRVEEAKGEVVYLCVDERRPQLAYYKNTLMNLVAPRALVAAAVLRGAPNTAMQVRERALFLSRLFKVEFLYRVGVGFGTIFDEIVERLERDGLVERREDAIAISENPERQQELAFLADLVRDSLESYWVATRTLEDLDAAGTMDRKGLVKAALETGRSEYLAGRVATTEALSRTSFENAIDFFVDQGVVVEREKRLALDPVAGAIERRQSLAEEIRGTLDRT